jgi:hypothetical protein
VAITITAVIFIFVSCTTSGDDPSSPGGDIGGDVSLDKSKVQIFATVYPVSENQSTEPTAYRAYCQIEDTTAVDGRGDFSSAAVRVNGTNLLTSNGWYFSSSNVGALSTGGSVVLDISETRLGDIHVAATVPISVTSFTLNPSLPPHGTPNTQNTYQMSWTGNGADWYLCGYMLYNNNYSILKGIAYQTPFESFTFGASDLSYEGNLAPFIKFLLQTITEEAIMGFISGSGLRVAGVTIVSQHNI